MYVCLYDTLLASHGPPRDRDEYVFLKPNHVLPEFLMHVQIVKQPEKNSTKKSNPPVPFSPPMNILSLPHFEMEDKKQKDSSRDKDRDTSPSKPLHVEKTRKLNDWMGQLDNALNNPNASSMTAVQKSTTDTLSAHLVTQTGAYLRNLKYFYVLLLQLIVNSRAYF
jgi:hypothetical protein